MKVITAIQVSVFILLIGFAGGWENGDVSDFEIGVIALIITAIILSLQLMKCIIKSAECRVKEDFRKRKSTTIHNSSFLILNSIKRRSN